MVPCAWVLNNQRLGSSGLYHSFRKQIFVFSSGKRGDFLLPYLTKNYSHMQSTEACLRTDDRSNLGECKEHTRTVITTKPRFHVTGKFLDVITHKCYSETGLALWYSVWQQRTYPQKTMASQSSLLSISQFHTVILERVCFYGTDFVDTASAFWLLHSGMELQHSAVVGSQLSLPPSLAFLKLAFIYTPADIMIGQLTIHFLQE